MALTTNGLLNGGATTHYRFQYDDSLAAPGGLEPARTNAVVASAENDFNLMSEWFGNTSLDVNIPIAVNVTQNGGGASWSRDSSGNLVVTVNPSTSDQSVIRYLIISEMTENFMRAQGRGWFGANTEGSQGEGLSRFLGAQFYSLFGFGNNAPPGFQDSKFWLSSARLDFVNNPNPSDDNPDAVTGCALLFIWYLFSQQGFNTTDIVAAGGSPLSAVYKNLTGDANDPFPLFKALVDKILPGTSTITTGNLDNPFPATFDGILLQVRGGPVFVVYGNGRFQVPDPATLARLFPGAQIFPCGDFPFGLNIIPDDGTLLREESSPQVWLIQDRARVPAPPGAPGPVHLLWNGALDQIPLHGNVIVGVVTDSAGRPLQDADIIITTSSGFLLELSTDSHGGYNSGNVAVGTYEIQALQDGFVPASATVTVLPGVPVTTQNFALATTVPFTIVGRVTDDTGAPVVATVKLTQNSPVPGVITTTADPSGNYSLTVDPGPFTGTFTLLVTATGFASETRTFTVPNGATLTINITLLRQGVLTGRVTDRLGQPIGGAHVTAGSADTFTDLSGTYKLSLDPGPYTVTASAPRFTPVTAALNIPPGATVFQDFVLSATIPGSIAGTVFDDNGPHPGARITIANVLLTTSDGNGKYTVTNLQPGPTQIEASAGVRFIPDKETVTVISGETVTQDLFLDPKGVKS